MRVELTSVLIDVFVVASTVALAVAMVSFTSVVLSMLVQ
ncbi:hypothetical protein PR003_g11924 [Phytophthora rubi]|uniref:Uncharacterized protein n=1 Tax=Phytophthora rubi TaxID=129364 RepID=A0A6A4F9T6_9STRA|nr:hypothetical protein PR002_g11517 [Phytophthora rubi]KAE9337614.1 hypothetical protein PR003_g11924 [Phytophthora rubi]